MKKRDRIAQALTFATFGGLTCSLALVGALVWSTHLHRLFFARTPYDVTVLANGMQVQISPPLAAKGNSSSARILKISYPFSDARGGCEFTYGAAVYTYEPTNPRTSFYEDPQPRYLFKFTYDYKSERCESKDLAIESNDMPKSIQLQLVDVAVSSQHVTEVPRERGIAIHYVLGRTRPEITITTIPATEPFLSQRETARNALFSSNDVPTAIITPEQSVESQILDAFEERTQKCRRLQVCDAIHIAVSRIDEPRIFAAIQKAKDAGIRVDIILSPLSRKRGSLAASEPIFLAPQTGFWMWLRGNSVVNPAPSLLPMHAKFAIFGDDLVISSNTTYSFSWFYRTREVGLRYEGKKNAAIFNEIFTMIRTSVLYPLRVDTSAPVTLLVNAERNHRYSASSRNSFVEVQTQEGVKSSAYGILYAMLEKNPGKLDLVMSPLAYGCAFYRERLCFFDILSERAARGKLELWLNSYFYLNADLQTPHNDIFWNSEALSTHLALNSRFSTLQEVVPGSANATHLMILPQEGTSSFHQRLALLGDDTIIGGSANFAKSSTLNTIEIVRDKVLHDTIQREVASFKDPYFIVNVKKPENQLPHFNECEFVLERDALSNNVPTQTHRYAAEQILEVASRTSGRKLNGTSVSVAVPKDLPRLFESAEYFRHAEFEERSLQGSLSSPSSWLCVNDRSTNTSFAVKMP